MALANSLPKGLASITLGEHQYVRSLIANSVSLTTGQLLYALEGAHNNGPWDTPENYRRFNGVLRYSLNQGGIQQSLTAMAYTSQWRSSDQVPQRAIDSQLVGRYGTIDPTPFVAVFFPMFFGIMLVFYLNRSMFVRFRWWQPVGIAIALILLTTIYKQRMAIAGTVLRSEEHTSEPVTSRSRMPSSA